MGKLMGLVMGSLMAIAACGDMAPAFAEESNPIPAADTQGDAVAHPAAVAKADGKRAALPAQKARRPELTAQDRLQVQVYTLKSQLQKTKIELATEQNKTNALEQSLSECATASADPQGVKNLSEMRARLQMQPNEEFAVDAHGDVSIRALPMQARQ